MKVSESIAALSGQAADLRVQLGLCCVPTARGNACELAPFDGMPCCWDHVPRWVAADFANRRAFVTPRVMRVGRVWRSDSQVVVGVHKRRGAPIKLVWAACGLGQFTGLRLDPDEAVVLADLLWSLGNTPAAELILMHVAVLANAQNPAHPMT